MVVKFLPFLGWFSGYTKATFRADAIAGLTVALVLIPQSMAYAQLAGMPAYYGLYAALLPPILAAMFGSSRQLATGPVAVVSLMTAASLEPLATAGSEGYIAYAILLAFMVGLFQFALGILRLGLVVNFLSHPVVNGFTNAAAIIIATSQLSKIFGVSVDKADHHYETIWRVLQSALQYTHWPTLGMGLLALGIMVGVRKIHPKIPNVLVAVLVTTTISWATGFHHDAKVEKNCIQSPKVQHEIASFNTALSLIDERIAQRAALSALLQVAEEEQDEERIISIENQLRMLTMQISRRKEEARRYRAALRTHLFKGAIEENRLAYYLQDSAPEKLQYDQRIWRMRVGNSMLDPTAITMMGGGAVVGDIPSGIPSLAMPRWDWGIMLHLFPFAAVISLLGFMEAISIAKAMAAKTGQRLDPNQELIGQGIANMVGAFGGSYPASGSFSRSAVNLQAGAVSGMSSVFTSFMVGVVLLFFTPLLYHLPQAVLAAVIMMAVIGLVNIHGFIHAWKAQWYDGAISILSFLCTLVFAPHLDRGIMIGVGLSVWFFLVKSMRPNVVFFPHKKLRTSKTTHSESIEENQNTLALVRFEGPLFFANASFLEEQIATKIMENAHLEHILIVANGINDMDASGEEALAIIVDRVRSEGRDISLCEVNESVMNVLKRTKLLQKIGEDHIYTTTEAAVGAL